MNGTTAAGMPAIANDFEIGTHVVAIISMTTRHANNVTEAE